MLIEDLVTWLRYNVILENGDIMSFSVGYCDVCPFSITAFDYAFRMLKLFIGLKGPTIELAGGGGGVGGGGGGMLFFVQKLFFGQHEN